MRDDGALAIIGPFSSGEAKAAFPVGERLGIVNTKCLLWSRFD